MASRLNTIADAAVVLIAAAIAGNVGDTTTVERTYLPDVLDPDYAAAMTTRKVYLSGMGYSQAEALSRGQDLNEYVLRILVVNRYTDAGQPSKSWTDTQIDWVETYIYDLLSDARGFTVSSAYPETGEVPVAWEPELLSEHKLFWSESVFSFRRDE